MEAAGNGGSDDRQLPEDLRKMIEKMVKVIVIDTIHQEIVPIVEGLLRKVVGTQYDSPIVEGLLRKVVKEEIQSVKKRLFDSVHTNEISFSKERNLQLKFSDDGVVSDPILTGKEIKGKGDKPMEVSLVDEATDEVVRCGHEASSEVEILSLDASGDDNEHTHESFNSMIIREDDENKPRFAKHTYISLKEGRGILNDVKFRHISRHTKRYRCRLGARIKENFRGINVQEAWTKPFVVLDSRSYLYKKHYPPSLSDEVWRLKCIGKDGEPCKRLEKENIKTVKDFLFLLSVNPQSLEQIARARDTMWRATLDHARTCIIDDKNMYLNYPSSESNMGVIFDAVGGLKGVVNESHYVPVNNLSSDEKDHAHKSLLSAFKNREEVTSFDNEASLLQKFPYRSSVSIQEDSNINKYYPTLPEKGQIDNPVFIDTVHSPSTLADSAGSGSGSWLRFLNLSSASNEGGQPEEGEVNQPIIQPQPPGHQPTFIPFSSTVKLQTMGQLYEPDLVAHTPICQPNTSVEPLMIEIDPIMDEVRANWLVRYTNVMLWCVRARKMALGGNHIQKKKKVR